MINMSQFNMDMDSGTSLDLDLIHDTLRFLLQVLILQFHVQLRRLLYPQHWGKGRDQR